MKTMKTETVETKIINARVKAFAGEGVRNHRIEISCHHIFVWDSVAGHYTSCHCISHATHRRLAKIAGV